MMYPFKKIKNGVKWVYNRLHMSEREKFFRKYARYPRFVEAEITFRDMRFKTPDVPSVLQQLNEVFIVEKMRFSSQKETPVIFDCGANVGTVSVYYKKLFPYARIVAFEADQKVARYFSENMKRNGTEKDVELVEKAVWTDANGVEFGAEGGDGGSVFFPGNRTKVPSVRLRDYLAREKTVDLLKVDIEGAELAVLEDCKDALQKIGRIFVEYHGYKAEKQKLDVLLRLLSDSGYRYLLENATGSHHPFVETPGGLLDLQVNIYAHR